jgi:DNA-binding NarL/FixJ family response regulator
VLLDLTLRGLSGRQALERVLQRLQGVTVVVPSGEEDPALIREVIEHGAAGFIPKPRRPP